MPLPLIPLIAAGVAATGGAIGSAVNRRNARNTMNSWYNYAEDYSRTQANSSIFDSPAGKSLLKLDDVRARKELDSINNRAIAGGATMENQLAARQSANENRDRVTSQLLQYDDRNRRAWQEKGLDIAGQRANYNAGSYMQAAQDWSQWGGQMANAALSLGSTSLLGGMGGLGGAASSMAAGTGVAGSGANVFNSAVAASRSPQINYGAIPTARDVNQLAPLGYRKA